MDIREKIKVLLESDLSDEELSKAILTLSRLYDSEKKVKLSHKLDEFFK